MVLLGVVRRVYDHELLRHLPGSCCCCFDVTEQRRNNILKMMIAILTINITGMMLLLFRSSLLVVTLLKAIVNLPTNILFHGINIRILNSRMRKRITADEYQLQYP
jgi:hypothetical protein